MRFSPRSKLKTAVAIAGVAILTAGLAGCSSGGGGGDGGSATKGEITWWSWTPDNNVADAEIAAFNEKYPDIKVNYRRCRSTTTPRCSGPRSRRTTAPTSSR